jgi:DNA-binding transcriptional MocR family regulator
LELSRESFAGDMDKAIIALAVGVRTAEHPDAAQLTQAQLASGDVEILPGLGSNVRSLADSLGMPRETVRRKVQEMVADGFLVRRQRKLYFTAQGYRRLAAPLEAYVRMVVIHHQVVSSLEPPPALAGLE